jgi:predicted TIM-barrel fold metal-dependent hydrolase
MDESYNLDWLISVDDHAIEPPELWEHRLPASMREAGPRFFEDDEGWAWHYEDHRLPMDVGHVGGAYLDDFDKEQAWVRSAPGFNGPKLRPVGHSFEQIDPSCFDPQARVAAMDRDHTLASLLFPNLPGFAGKYFNGAKDKATALQCMRVYNDWILEDWCAAHPGRFIGNVLIPFWDPEEAARELERAAGRGARAFCFSEDPGVLGYPSVHDPNHYWDPILRTANDAQLALTAHLATGQPVQARNDPAIPARVNNVQNQFGQCRTVLDWLYSGNLVRFPDLKICLSEGGIGWIPYILEQAAWFDRFGQRMMTTAQEAINMAGPLGDDLPSPWEQFRTHMFGCFIVDGHGARCLREIGVDNVMIEVDYPHLSTEWPNTLEVAREAIGYLDPDEQYKILRSNAERVFRFEPVAPPAWASGAEVLR